MTDQESGGQQTGQLAAILQALMGYFSPREAYGEVVPGDPGAATLLNRFKTSPQTLPSWVIPYEAAQARPETVTVRTKPGYVPLQDESGRNLEAYGIYDQSRREATIGQAPASEIKRQGMTASPLFTLPHELGHFLADMLNTHPKYHPMEEERWANAHVLPIDYPLLRAGYESQKASGDPLSLFWSLVQRQMEPVAFPPQKRAP